MPTMPPALTSACATPSTLNLTISTAPGLSTSTIRRRTVLRFQSGPREVSKLDSQGCTYNHLPIGQNICVITFYLWDIWVNVQEGLPKPLMKRVEECFHNIFWTVDVSTFLRVLVQAVNGLIFCYFVLNDHTSLGVFNLNWLPWSMKKLGMGQIT